MSVVPFSTAASAAVFSPSAGEPWTQTTALSRSVLRPGTPSAQIDGLFLGTSLELQLAAQVSLNALVYVRIDGALVTPVPVLAALNSFEWLTLVSGLTDTLHTFSVKFIATNILVWVERFSAFRVTGAAPAMGAPAHFGPQTRLVTLDGVAPVLGEGGPQSWKKRAGPGDWINQRTSDGFVSYDSGLSFYATVTALWVWVTLLGGRWQLEVDRGSPNPLVYTVNAPVVGPACTGWLLLANNLDDTQRHHYTVVNVGPAQGFAHRHLMTGGGSGLDLGAVPTLGPYAVIYGNSIAGGASVTGTPTIGDTSQALLSRICRARGWAKVNRGVGATTLRRFPGGTVKQDADSLEARVSELTSLPGLPELILLEGGTNGMGLTAGSPPLTQTPAGLQAAMDRELSAILALRPEFQDRMLMLGILPRQGFTQLVIDSYNAALLAGINGRIPLVDPREANLAGAAYKTGGAFESSRLPDGLHPNELGYTELLALLAPYLPPLPVVAPGTLLAPVGYHPGMDYQA
jgi:lysophospholipase L1-like esterase